MFLLTKAELGSIPLKIISRIDVAFYESRNEVLNIFNLESAFEENAIPMITSFLECKPIITRRKTYFGLDSNYIINYPYNHSPLQLDLPSGCGNSSGFPSFYLDIEAFNKSQQPSRETRDIQTTLVYPKSKELVRIYSRIANVDTIIKGFNPQDAFSSKEELVISWATGWGGLEIRIIPSKKTCSWHLVINVIEEHQFIDNKANEVNTWLEKIHKLKSTIKIANQDTNLE